MNPETGEFHELDIDGTIKDTPPDPPPELVGKKPPSNWPIFKLGEKLTTDFIVEEITGKDLVVSSVFTECQPGDVVKLKDRDFRVRKKAFNQIWLRPVEGRLVKQ